MLYSLKNIIQTKNLGANELVFGLLSLMNLLGKTLRYCVLV